MTGKQAPILIVDDEAVVRRLLQQKLSIKGYHCLEAGSADQALDRLRNSTVGLMILDIKMPKVDDYSACSIIKTDQTTKGIPVVMLTAVGHELNKELAKKIDADGYITKPFSLQDLLHTIKQFLKCPK